LPREFSRGRRVADLIQQQLARLIQQEVKDPRIGMVTINEVEVSRDLAYADVYFTRLGEGGVGASNEGDPAKAAEAALANAAGFLRSELAKLLETRATPKLRFHYDATIESGARLDRMIEEARARDRGLPDEDD